MNWKRNPTLILALCAALVISVVIIAILFMNRTKDRQQESYPSRIPPQHIPPPPQQEHESMVQGGGKPALVLFSAGWCPNSTKMAPEWKKVEQSLGSSGRVDIITLDDKNHAEEMKKHDINGFPTVRWYPEGFPSDVFTEYNGERTAEKYIQFVQSKEGV